MAVLARAVCVVLVVLAAGCRSGPEQWGPFRGQVVDAETGAPIPGANVMVLWIREPPALHFTQQFYDAQETVTDAAGRFEIPRRTRLLTAFVNEPAISVFAPAYLMTSREVSPPDGRAYIDPTTVKMKPLKTAEERCKWRPGEPWASQTKVPRYIVAVQDYNLALDCEAGSTS